MMSYVNTNSLQIRNATGDSITQSFELIRLDFRQNTNTLHSHTSVPNNVRITTNNGSSEKMYSMNQPASRHDYR